MTDALGLDLEAQTEYGITPEVADWILDSLRVACERLGQRAVAKAVRMSLRDVSAFVQGKREPTPSMLTKLYRMVPWLKVTNREFGRACAEVSRKSWTISAQHSAVGGCKV